MKKGLHGTLTGLLGLGMTLGSVGTVFAAPPAKDITGHWAEKQLQEWVDKGNLKGFEDGTLKPNQSITRAEFIALVNRIFGYVETSQVEFKDLPAANWAYTDVARAVNAGYIQGYEDNTIHPGADVTRQEAAAMISKVVGLTAGQTGNVSAFKDADKIAAWSKQGVAAVLESKIMNGYPDETFAPLRSLTRAEAVVLIDAAFATKKAAETVTYDKAGTFGGSDKETQVIHGNVVISAPGVTLQNVQIDGDLLLAEGIGNGDVTLKNVTVHGTTNVQGGGENSIHFVDSILVNIVVNKKDGTVRIVAEGSTTTQSVVVKSSAKLEEDNVTGAGFTDVELSKELPADAKVTLNGTFDDVDIFAASISVQLLKGSIDNVHVDGSAGNSSIEVSNEAKIIKLVLDAVAKLLGSGQIQTAEINDGAKGSTFQTKPNQTEGPQKDSIKVPIPPAPSSSGGSGSGGSSGGSSGGGSNGGGNSGGGTTPPVVDETAPALSVTVSKGSNVGTTKVNAVVATGNSLKVQVLNTEPQVPNKGANVPAEAKDYISSANISASVDQWLSVYEVNSNGKVVKFFKKQLVRADIKLIDSETALMSALEAASDGDTITLAGDIELTGEISSNVPYIGINVQKKVTIDGAGFTIAGGIQILSDDVTLKNLKVKDSKANGINVYQAHNVVLDNVSVEGSAKAGIVVADSTVTVNNIHTANNVWGGINVDKGNPELTITGTSTHENEKADIWLDRDNDIDHWIVDSGNQYTGIVLGEKFVYKRGLLPPAETVNFDERDSNEALLQQTNEGEDQTTGNVDTSTITTEEGI